jgi:hypothetical protein
MRADIEPQVDDPPQRDRVHPVSGANRGDLDARKFLDRAKGRIAMVLAG